jgi:AcrR family transcriptional regulator
MAIDSTPAPATTTRPGGRSARVRAAVHRATEELLAEGGPEAATIPAVAARAGVHATTVYRRWGSAADLLSAVALGRLTGDVVVPDTGSLQGDLAHWLRDVLTDLSDPDVLLMLRTALGTARDASGRCACVADREAQLDAMLEADRARGNTPPEAARLIELLLAPVYFSALFDVAPLPAVRVAQLVEHALAGAA